MNKWKKQGLAIGVSLCMVFSFVGCMGQTEEKNETVRNTEIPDSQDFDTEAIKGDSVGKISGESKLLRDKDTLYENEDESSVVTMYLTVTSGNASDHTDHTWTEVNSYSVYDYEAMGVERYAVNGLLQVGDENGPIEGELGYGQVAPNATVTIRGQTSSRYVQKNYRISIRDEKGTWNDQKVINLNKHEQDPTRFANKMCYDLMEELPGMIALRTQFVHLYVKDLTEGGNAVFTDYGLYTQVEQLNKRALRSHGLDRNGHLYKINSFEFFRYEDVIMLKSEADYDLGAFEEKLEIKGDDDHSKLIAMLEDVNDFSVPIEEVLEEWFEKDNLFSWMAFHILMGNVDTQSRNVFLYSPLNSNTWYFISWDNDGAFIDSRRMLAEEAQEIGWEKGVSNYWGNVLFQRILKSETLRAELDDKIQEYRGILTEEKLAAMQEEYVPVVEEYAFRYPDSQNMPVTRSEYQQLISYLPSEVERNYQHYLDSLKEPMPFFIALSEPEGGGLVFQWDNAYDFDEENIWYTFELAADYSFTDPLISEEGIFIPEYEYEGELEPGQYFVRIRAVNESGYGQYAFDYYVTEDSMKQYGVLCFYVMPDGSIEEDVYEE